MQVNGSSNNTFSANQLESGVVSFVHDGSETSSANFIFAVEDGDEDASSPASNTFTLVVNPVDDSAIITGDFSGSGVEDNTLTGTLQASDPEGTGDGTIFSVGSNPSNGSATIGAANGDWVYTPNAHFFGNDQFTVTVTDDLGGTTNQNVSLNLSAVQDSTIISGNINGSGLEDAAIYDTLTASDPDGLTDGSIFTITTNPSHGKVSIHASAGNWAYVPYADLFGDDQFTVTVTDDQGGTASQVISISLSNLDDSASISGDTTGTGFEDQGISGTLVATDIEGLNDGSIYTVSTNPSMGGAVINHSSGVWNYTPTADFFGDDQFTVTVSDDLGGTSSQLISLTVKAVDDIAIITGDSTGSGAEDQSITGTLQASDNDGLGDGSLYSVSLSPTNGNAGVEPADGNWTYTPNADFFGDDQFTITVTDDLGGTTQQVISVKVTAVNDLPSISDNILFVTINEDTELILSSANIWASDVDKDALSWAVVKAPSQGEVSELSQSDNNITALVYSPHENVSSSDHFSLSCSDGLGQDEILVEVTIVPINDGVEITSVSSFDLTMEEDGTFNSPSIEASDLEGDNLIWSVSSPASNGTAAILSGGPRPEVDYTPKLNFNGTDQFSLSVSDGDSSAQVLVNVEVLALNDSPVVVAPPQQQLSVGDVFELSIDASDVDGDVISLSNAGSGRSWIQLDASNLTLKGTVPDYEAGQLLSLDLVVSDGVGTQNVRVEIQVEAQEDTLSTSSPLEASPNTITIVDAQGQAIGGAAVKVPGQQVRYTDAQGQVSLTLPVEMTSRLSVSAQGFQSQTISLDGHGNGLVLDLPSADLLVHGKVSLLDAQSPLGVKISASSSLGVHETYSNGDGSYELHIPSGAANWSLGASRSAYGDQEIKLAVQDGELAIRRDFQLTPQTFFSWRSHQDRDGDVVTIWVRSKPPFQSGDEDSALVEAELGSAGEVSFNVSDASLSFPYNTAAGVSQAAIDFSATPSAGTKSELRIDLNLGGDAGQQQNLHLFQRISSVAGSHGEIVLAGMDSDKEDLSSVDFPPFGVSSNVLAIKIERVDEKLSLDRLRMSVYHIEAYSIDGSGAHRVAGRDEIEEIHLSFSFDPTTWDPTIHHVIYSDNDGSTWTRVDRQDIISVDTQRHTVTLKTNHLSLWSLSSYGGLRGLSGGDSSNGGGCLLKGVAPWSPASNGVNMFSVKALPTASYGAIFDYGDQKKFNMRSSW